jgi:hypothetical protein
VQNTAPGETTLVKLQPGVVFKVKLLVPAPVGVPVAVRKIA